MLLSLKNLAKLIREETKSKSIQDQFLYDLTKTIELQNKQEVRVPSQKFKPSSMGGCKRRIYFEIIGAEMDKGNSAGHQLIGMGESGTDRHERIQGYVMKMREHGLDCDWISVEEWIKLRKPAGTTIVERKGNEFKCHNSIFNISFMCDGIIKYKGIYYILEIKTEASFKFSGRVEIYPDHIVQGTCYSACLGIDKVIFIYENRDMLSKKAFLLNVTPEMIEDYVVSTVEHVNQCVSDKSVPEKTDNLNLCSRCSYTEACALC